MIDNRSPFAGLAARLMSSRASVPSVGGNGAGGSVSLALERVAVAEKNLQDARDAARAAARQAGVDLAGLFSEGLFIARATGERWRDEARREGEKAMVNILSRSVSMESMDENSPFRHLAVRLKQIRPEDWPEHVAKMRAVMDSAGSRWERMRAAGYFEAIEAEDHERAAEIYREATPELFAQSKGAAILRAGARARMSGDTERPLPEKGSFADRVLAAARKRDGKV